MSRALQHQLHTRLELACRVLDLPVQGEDLERLAVELTPAVKALIAEATDAHAETVPVRYAVVATQDEQAGVCTTVFTSTARIGMDVDPTSPAALLAAELRAHQADVRATDVPSPTYLGLTIRPQSLHAWRWWIDKLGIHPDAVTLQDTAAYATGTLGDVVIAVQADEVPALLVDEAAARLLGLIAETTPDPA